jgi:hypothetical protein
MFDRRQQERLREAQTMCEFIVAKPWEKHNPIAAEAVSFYSLYAKNRYKDDKAGCELRDGPSHQPRPGVP